MIKNQIFKFLLVGIFLGLTTLNNGMDDVHFNINGFTFSKVILKDKVDFINNRFILKKYYTIAESLPIGILLKVEGGILSLVDSLTCEPRVSKLSENQIAILLKDKEEINKINSEDIDKNLVDFARKYSNDKEIIEIIENLFAQKKGPIEQELNTVLGVQNLSNICLDYLDLSDL